MLRLEMHKKGPVLLESPLKGMILNSKLHHTVVATQVKAIQSNKSLVLRLKHREVVVCSNNFCSYRLDFILLNVGSCRAILSQSEWVLRRIRWSL